MPGRVAGDQADAGALHRPVERHALEESMVPSVPCTSVSSAAARLIPHGVSRTQCASHRRRVSGLHVTGTDRANRAPARATASASSGGDSTTKSASMLASTISGHSSVSTFISRTARPSVPGTVAQRPTTAATSVGSASRTTRTAYRCGIRRMPGLDEGERVLGGQLARPERLAAGARLADPVDPERAPVLAVAVVGDEVPAPAHRHHPVRLDPAVGRLGSPLRCR